MASARTLEDRTIAVAAAAGAAGAAAVPRSAAGCRQTDTVGWPPRQSGMRHNGVADVLRADFDCVSPARHRGERKGCRVHPNRARGRAARGPRLPAASRCRDAVLACGPGRSCSKGDRGAAVFRPDQDMERPRVARRRTAASREEGRRRSSTRGPGFQTETVPGSKRRLARNSHV